MLTIAGIQVDPQLALGVSLCIGLLKPWLADPKSPNYANVVRAYAIGLGLVLALARYWIATGAAVGGAGFEQAGITGFVAGAGAVAIYHLTSGDLTSVLGQATNPSAVVEVGKITDVPPADPNAPKP